jgi:hypothetical protein
MFFKKKFFTNLNLFKNKSFQKNKKNFESFFITYNKNNIFFQQNYGIKTDINKYIEQLKIRANEGESYALNKLGDIHLYGQGVEKDIDKALEYLNLAASKDNQYSMNTLGEYYAGKRDLRCIDFYKKSAEKGFFPRFLVFFLADFFFSHSKVILKA